LASAATFSRLENAATRKDIYRIGKAFVEQFIASYSKPPKVIVLDMDHSEDPTHGQQELALFSGYYKSYCYLPLFIFEGLSGKLVTALLRPGKRPTGAENAMILKRILKLLRAKWPNTHIILRGDGHFSNPELMQLVLDDSKTDFIFGVGILLFVNPARSIQHDTLPSTASFTRNDHNSVGLQTIFNYFRNFDHFSFIAPLSLPVVIPYSRFCILRR
jgi:hypothetical protein